MVSLLCDVAAMLGRVYKSFRGLSHSGAQGAEVQGIEVQGIEVQINSAKTVFFFWLCPNR
jgi:hypothetical protein